MPTPETVESFVQLVVASPTVEAMVRFYAEDASMRENMAAPRTGKAALIKYEEEALASIKTLKAPVRNRRHMNMILRSRAEGLSLWRPLN
jgi:ketosteroid isomerase-like protein